MKVELFYVVGGINIWQDLYTTRNTYQAIVSHEISEIERKYGIKEKDIRIDCYYTEKEMRGIK